jgi:nucleoside-diphosphate-sugar epimerase
VLNTEATIGLARAARRAGAKRFVFLSSIRAQCGPTSDTVLTEAVEPRPTDAYGKSKLAAERGLAELDLDWVSLRAVLVYGPGVKGNMAQLMRLARSPFPLPLGSLGARRSLLALENLSAAIEAVLAAPGTRARGHSGHQLRSARRGYGRSRPTSDSFESRQRQDAATIRPAKGRAY